MQISAPQPTLPSFFREKNGFFMRKLPYRLLSLLSLFSRCNRKSQNFFFFFVVKEDIFHSHYHDNLWAILQSKSWGRHSAAKINRFDNIIFLISEATFTVRCVREGAKEDKCWATARIGEKPESHGDVSHLQSGLCWSFPHFIILSSFSVLSQNACEAATTTSSTATTRSCKLPMENGKMFRFSERDIVFKRNICYLHLVHTLSARAPFSALYPHCNTLLSWLRMIAESYCMAGSESESCTWKLNFSHPRTHMKFTSIFLGLHNSLLGCSHSFSIPFLCCLPFVVFHLFHSTAP